MSSDRLPFSQLQHVPTVDADLSINGLSQSQMHFTVPSPYTLANHISAFRQAQNSTVSYLNSFTQPMQQLNPANGGAIAAQSTKKRDITKRQPPIPPVRCESPLPSAVNSVNHRANVGCAHGFPYNETECLYSCSHWTHREGMEPQQVINQYVRAMQQAAADNHRNVCGYFDAPYGDRCAEKIDIWGYGRVPDGAPVIAMIHGGFWQEGSRQLFTSMVSPLVRSGALVAVIGYDMVTRSDLDTIVVQISQALQYLDNMCQSQGSRGLYLCGHSAGAHLATMGLVRVGQPLQSLKGMFLLSGVYDLVPLIGTYIDKPIKLIQPTAARLSPISQVETLSSFTKNAFVAVVVAQHDSPAFKQQAEKFYQAFAQHSGDVTPVYKEIPEEDHFTMIEKLSDRRFALTDLICSWMHL